MIYVFYSNDPLFNDQGGGVEHFRGIYRALTKTSLEYKLVASKMGNTNDVDHNVIYISHGSNFLRYYIRLWLWFFRNRKSFTKNDVFHFHRNYAAWPKYILARNKGKSIITYHGLTGFVIRGVIGPITRPIRFVMEKLERKSLCLADRIIFVSDRDRQIMRGSMLGDNYSKTVVIPAAFDESLFKTQTVAPVKYKSKILMVGRLSDIKNIPLAIDAFSKLCGNNQNVELTIAGDGEDREKIEQHISSSSCSEKINLLGRVEHHEIPQLMKEHGIVLLTSRSEASPTVVKEAIASLRPVVTTDVGDVKTWVTDGKNGFICDSVPSSLAQGLVKAQALIENEEYQQSVDLSELSEENIMNKVIENYVHTDV